jgi:hypothetical protein
MVLLLSDAARSNSGERLANRQTNPKIAAGRRQRSNTALAARIFDLTPATGTG